MLSEYLEMISMFVFDISISRMIFLPIIAVHIHCYNGVHSEKCLLESLIEILGKRNYMIMKFGLLNVCRTCVVYFALRVIAPLFIVVHDKI